MDENCIFCKIIKGEIPSKKVYEDEEFFSFHDINPAATIHILVIPKVHIPNLQEVTDETVISKAYCVIQKIAVQENVAKTGYRVIVNCGKDAGQEVMHLHFHILAGEELGPKIR